MKRLLIIFSIPVLLQLSMVFGQEQEEELISPQRSSVSKIGGAGGFTAFWLFADVGPLNEFLKNAHAAQLYKNGFPLYGGQGYGYIMVIKNLRVGGMGAGGSIQSKSLAGNTERDVKFSASFGGVTIEYVVPVIPRLDIAVGTMLGGGGIDITISRDNGSRRIWETIWEEYGSSDPVADYTKKLSGSFFIYQPSVNIEYSVLRWVGLRVGVSYLGMAGAEWKADDKYEVFSVPNNISGKGWMINTGIFLGTFIY